MTEAEKGYCACAIDGEGCIQLGRAVKVRGNPNYEAGVSVTNTSMDFLSWLKRKTGLGRIQPVGEAKKGHKQVFAWSLYVHEIKPFLLLIMDYLVIKRPQAELLVEYIDGTRENAGRWNPLTLDESITKDLIWRELRELNKRGAKDESDPST